MRSIPSTSIISRSSGSTRPSSISMFMIINTKNTNTTPKITLLKNISIIKSNITIPHLTHTIRHNTQLNLLAPKKGHILRFEKIKHRIISLGSSISRHLSRSISPSLNPSPIWHQAGMRNGSLPPLQITMKLGFSKTNKPPRHPPPSDSKPEAINFPHTHYAMSSDTAPFVPPERYPTPPKNMWYEVPKEPPANPKEKPKPVFPWETHQPRPTRVFVHHEPEPIHTEPAHTVNPWEGQHSHTPTGSHVYGETGPLSSSSPGTTEDPAGGGAATHTPTNSSPRTVLSAPSDIWSSFPRTNAWDTVPEINRYVDALAQKHRRTRSRGKGTQPPSGGGGGGGGGGPGSDFGWSRRGSRVTDFPSEEDRPSLPVTPAPIRRPRRQWGGHGGHAGHAGGGGGSGEGEELLLAAEGVPAQAEWVCVHGIWWGPADCLCDLTNVLRYHKDPAARLAKLARQQSELLFQRLGGWEDEHEHDHDDDDDERGEREGGGWEGEGQQKRREIPARALPFGSEGVRSPTYVVPSGPLPAVVSPKPVKPVTATSAVNRILAAAPELITSPEIPATAPAVWLPPPPTKVAPAPSVAPAPATTAMTELHAHGILAPSYQGPGAAFEKGEDIPTFETPALPTEEDRDVLET